MIYSPCLATANNTSTVIMGNSGVDLQSLAQVNATIASTSFVIIFGVITIYPLLSDFFEKREGMAKRRVRSLRSYEYRLMKRLIKGKSVKVMFFGAVLFLISDLFTLFGLLFWIDVIIITGVLLTLFALVLIISVIIIVAILGQTLTEEEFDKIEEYSDSEVEGNDDGQDYEDDENDG